MLFLYGTAMLVVAILLLSCARYAVTRFEHSSRMRAFAATEVMALTITSLAAFGLCLLVAGTVSAANGVGLVELGASLGVIALTITGVVRVFRSAKPAVTVKPVGRATT